MFYANLIKSSENVIWINQHNRFWRFWHTLTTKHIRSYGIWGKMDHGLNMAQPIHCTDVSPPWTSTFSPRSTQTFRARQRIEAAQVPDLGAFEGDITWANEGSTLSHACILRSTIYIIYILYIYIIYIYILYIYIPITYIHYIYIYEHGHETTLNNYTLVTLPPLLTNQSHWRRFTPQAPPMALWWKGRHRAVGSWKTSSL